MTIFSSQQLLPATTPAEYKMIAAVRNIHLGLRIAQVNLPAPPGASLWATSKVDFWKASLHKDVRE